MSTREDLNEARRVETKERIKLRATPTRTTEYHEQFNRWYDAMMLVRELTSVLRVEEWLR